MPRVTGRAGGRLLVSRLSAGAAPWTLVRKSLTTWSDCRSPYGLRLFNPDSHGNARRKPVRRDRLSILRKPSSMAWAVRKSVVWAFPPWQSWQWIPFFQWMSLARSSARTNRCFVFSSQSSSVPWHSTHMLSSRFDCGGSARPSSAVLGVCPLGRLCRLSRRFRQPVPAIRPASLVAGSASSVAAVSLSGGLGGRFVLAAPRPHEQQEDEQPGRQTKFAACFTGDYSLPVGSELAGGTRQHGPASRGARRRARRSATACTSPSFRPATW